jgi:hypothetical protein
MVKLASKGPIVNPLGDNQINTELWMITENVLT